MKHTKNIQGFAIILGMGIVLSVSLTAIYLLEYVIPFSKDTKGIEFSSNAYYQGSSAVEDALYFVAKRPNLADEQNDPLDVPNGTHNTSVYSQAQSVDLGYDMTASGSTIPPAGEGNSDYGDDWNKLSIGSPLQIEVGEDRWNGAEIRLRIPNTGIGESTRLKDVQGGIVAWQLSSQNDTINSEATGRVDDDSLKITDSYELDLGPLDGKTLTNSPTIDTFDEFYNINCDDIGEKCTLKISIVNELAMNDSNSTPIPYLEYQIIGASSIPLRYTHIQAEGYSHGFKKEIDIKVPQQTVNEAFDFTVFQ